MDETPPSKCWLYHPDGRSQIFSGVDIEHAKADGWAVHDRRTGGEPAAEAPPPEPNPAPTPADPNEPE